MKRLALTVIALASLATSACINIEQTLTLERDLSGTAGFSMKLDTEPVIEFMAALHHSMSGEPGAPTAADLAEARQVVLGELAKSNPMDMVKEKAELQQSMPAGVKLLDVTLTNEGLKMWLGLKLAFDSASKLDAVKLFKAGAAPESPMKNPAESPFGGLHVVDEGKTILVSSPPQKLMAGRKAEVGSLSGGDPSWKTQVDNLFKDLRLSLKVTSPLEVVEHNAHHKEGNTLVWQFDVESLENPAAQMIRVRYRK